MGEWKEIPGYSRFKASEDGRILDSKTNREVSQCLTGRPQYYYVNVYTDCGKRKQRRVHHLVALAYLENPDNLPFVDHIDRNKYNNNLENLRWVTRSANNRNRDANFYVDVGLDGEKVLLVEKLEEDYPEDNNQRMYQYVYQRIVCYGEDFPTATQKWFTRKVKNPNPL